jgi:hypothetical protein
VFPKNTSLFLRILEVRILKRVHRAVFCLEVPGENPFPSLSQVLEEAVFSGS